MEAAVRRWPSRPLLLGLIATLVTVPALGAGLAVAQEEQQQLKLDLMRLVVPETREKLVRKGVLIKASCSQDCVLVVKVMLPTRIVKQLGLKKRVIGSGAAGAKANIPRWVRAHLHRGAGRLLEDYEGGGRLQVRVRGLP